MISNKEQQTSKKSSRQSTGMYKWALVLLIGLAGYLAYLVFSPFLTPITLAAVLAAIFYPLFQWIIKLFKGKKSLAAAVVVGLIVCCVFLPLFFFMPEIIVQSTTTVKAINSWVVSAEFEKLLGEAGQEEALLWLQKHLPFLELNEMDIKQAIQKFSTQAAQQTVSISTVFLGNVMIWGLDCLIMLFVLFFMLRDGEKIISYIKYISPLREDQENRIIDNLRKVSRSVLVGGFAVALLQGIAGGIGLALVGIPALFWGTLMGFASLVPVAGTGLVWVPACIYLLIFSSWQKALFLALWCGLGVTSIDTFLRPYFMREASGMPLLYIFLSVIGGLQVFGPAGLMYGPLILGFSMVMLRLYGEEFNDELKNTFKTPAGILQEIPDMDSVLLADEETEEATPR